MWKVVWMGRAGLPVKMITERLLEQGSMYVRKSRYFLLKKYNETSFVADHKKAPRRKLQGSEHFRFMDKNIKANPELTSRQLCGMATEIFRCKSVINIVKMAHKVLGWSAQKTQYGALISKVNKEKRTLGSYC